MTCLRICLSLGVLAGALALSACDSAPQSSQSRADAATVTACRQRADEVYNQQNRGEIYSANSSENAPFSANYVPGIPSRGLSQLYAHDKLVSDCVRNTGTGAERSIAPETKP